MARRREIITTGEMYHVYNRSVEKKIMYRNTFDYRRMLQLIKFYRFSKPPLRYSHFNRLNSSHKEQIIEKMFHTFVPIVEIHAFCLMPNHFHFLIRPLVDDGLSHFMNRVQHSYSKYFNMRYHRNGVLFQGSFKIVRIESDEQFVHTHRYIHLNPVTSFIIKFDLLNSYQWSSYRYMNRNYSFENFITNNFIWGYFSTMEKYENFLKDQVDYQRKLHTLVKFCQ